jgi:hypothetical protein
MGDCIYGGGEATGNSQEATMGRQCASWFTLMQALYLFFFFFAGASRQDGGGYHDCDKGNGDQKVMHIRSPEKQLNKLTSLI